MLYMHPTQRVEVQHVLCHVEPVVLLCLENLRSAPSDLALAAPAVVSGAARAAHQCSNAVHIQQRAEYGCDVVVVVPRRLLADVTAPRWQTGSMPANVASSKVVA